MKYGLVVEANEKVDLNQFKKELKEYSSDVLSKIKTSCKIGYSKKTKMIYKVPGMIYVRENSVKIKDIKLSGDFGTNNINFAGLISTGSVQQKQKVNIVIENGNTINLCCDIAVSDTDISKFKLDWYYIECYIPNISSISKRDTLDLTKSESKILLKRLNSNIDELSSVALDAYSIVHDRYIKKFELDS